MNFSPEVASAVTEEIKPLTDDDLKTMAKTIVWGQPPGRNLTRTDIENRLLDLLRRMTILTREEQAVIRKALDCAMKARLREADREASFDLSQFSTMRVRLRENPGKERTCPDRSTSSPTRS